MALHSLYCADVPLRNCSLTHSRSHRVIKSIVSHKKHEQLQQTDLINVRQ